MKFAKMLAAVLAAACLSVPHAYAQKLGALPVATTVNAGDKIPASQGGTTTVAITPSLLATYLASSFQPVDADLTAIAGLSTQSFGRSILTAADAAAVRSAIGLGTLATQSGTFSGSSSGTNTGDQTSVTGNAGTATKLATARAINGVAFDGTANVSIADTALTGASWTTYTPTLSCGSGTLTSATASGRYKQIGKTVFVQVTISIATNGTCINQVIFTLPNSTPTVANAIWVLAGRENAVTGKMLQGAVFGSSSSAIVTNYDNSFPGANGALLNVTGVYETN